MLDLMLNLLLFAFAEEMYPAMNAGLSPSFVTQERGLVIKTTGFNDKLPVGYSYIIFYIPHYNTNNKYFQTFVENIAEYLTHLSDKIDEEMFNVIKDKLGKGYHNKLLKPSKLARQVY